MKRRPNPCKCGWKWEGFHICVDLSAPEPLAANIKVGMPLEQRQRIAEAQRRRHADRKALRNGRR